VSGREQQVFRLMVEGSSTNQIADVLCVNPRTVEKHRANVMKKLGIHDLVAMVKYAIKIGMIDPELSQEYTHTLIAYPLIRKTRIKKQEFPTIKWGFPSIDQPQL
jgi:DNA-binding CsgD family transcriptional regulator